MTIKKHLKHSVKLFIESDGNFYTMAIRTSKAQLLKALDKLIPDTDPEPEPATKFSLRDEK